MNKQWIKFSCMSYWNKSLKHLSIEFLCKSFTLIFNSLSVSSCSIASSCPQNPHHTFLYYAAPFWIIYHLTKWDQILFMILPIFLLLPSVVQCFSSYQLSFVFIKPSLWSLSFPLFLPLFSHPMFDCALYFSFAIWYRYIFLWLLLHICLLFLNELLPIHILCWVPSIKFCTLLQFY